MRRRPPPLTSWNVSAAVADLVRRGLLEVRDPTTKLLLTPAELLAASPDQLLQFRSMRKRP